GSKVQDDASSKLHAVAAPATRFGQPSASEMGRRMSGGLAWASVEPSVKVTIECTIDCGCTTTSIASHGTSNSKRASISSKPLLTRVAELMVTSRPIDHVGCLSASATVTSCNC